MTSGSKNSSEREEYRPRPRSERLPAFPLIVLILLGLPLTTIAADSHHGGPVSAIALLDRRPAGEIVISAGFDGRVIIWQSDDLEPIDNAALAVGPITALHPLASEENGIIEVWGIDDVGAINLSPGFSLAAPRGWRSAILGEAVEREGTRLPRLTIGAGIEARIVAGGRIEVHLPKSLAPMTLAGNDLGTTALALVDDHRLLSGGNDGNLIFWNAETRERLHVEHAHDAPITALDLSTGAELAVTGGANGTVISWRVGETEISTPSVIAQLSFPILALALDQARERILVGSDDGRILSVPLSGETSIKAPPRPARLFAHAQTDDRGARLFNACHACHSVTEDDEGKMGPTFFGLLGRTAGTVPGYPYSAALLETDLVWTTETLSALFEHGPDQYLPGTTMPLQRMPDAEDRRALVAHIEKIIGGSEP